MFRTPLWCTSPADGEALSSNDALVWSPAVRPTLRGGPTSQQRDDFYLSAGGVTLTVTVDANDYVTVSLTSI
jgi:hypothetical protein